MPKASWVMSVLRALRSVLFLFLVLVERVRQERKWGPQTHPSFGRGGPYYPETTEFAKKRCQDHFARKDGNWCAVFDEEAFEVMGATSSAELCVEQMQAAAVLAAWWECSSRPGHPWMRT